MVETPTVSTDEIQPRHRIDFWSAMVANTFAPFEIVKSPLADFHGKFTASQIGELLLAQTDFAPSGAYRRKDMMRSAHFDGFMFAIPKKGIIEYADADISSIAVPGDIAFYDYTRSFDFNMKRSENIESDGTPPIGIETINITISRDVFTRLIGPAPKGAGLIIKADQPSNLIIRNFFSGLMANSRLLDSTMASRMATIGLDLLAAGLAERLSYEPKQSTSAATLAYRAKTFIESRLWDNDLDIAMVAAAMNMSARRLQMVFAEQQLTIGDFIWERRLQKAYQQLNDPVFNERSISEISFGVGFINVSHFARRFAQRFAMTPTECRQAARLNRLRKSFK